MWIKICIRIRNRVWLIQPYFADGINHLTEVNCKLVVINIKAWLVKGIQQFCGNTSDLCGFLLSVRLSIAKFWNLSWNSFNLVNGKLFFVWLSKIYLIFVLELFKQWYLIFSLRLWRFWNTTEYIKRIDFNRRNKAFRSKDLRFLIAQNYILSNWLHWKWARWNPWNKCR